MAASGIVLLGFVIGHLAGNLLIYAGRDAFNEYAATLQGMPLLVWTTRVVLLVALTVHVFLAVRLRSINKAARPQPYAVEKTVVASLASRWMFTSGMTVLAYVVYHLLHFTLGVVDPAAHGMEEVVDGAKRHDAFGMVVTSFQSTLVVLVYVLANASLAWHLSHGIASLFQTLGIHDSRYQVFIRRGGLALSALIGAGFISIPLAVQLHFLQLP